AVVELNFDEQYADQLTEGMSVELTINEVNYTGTISIVSKIAVASSVGLGSTIKVTVIPDTGGVLLYPGTTVVGEVNLGSREDVPALKRGAFLTTGSQKYLYRVQGDTAEKIIVTYGAIQSDTVELLSGVNAGDVIIVSGYQNFIQYSKVKLK
ncbi:unnamed protein product, partial [marine sediment metagenome]